MAGREAVSKAASPIVPSGYIAHGCCGSAVPGVNAERGCTIQASTRPSSWSEEKRDQIYLFANPILKTSWKNRLGKATYEWLNSCLVSVKQAANQSHHLSSSTNTRRG
jgi:hypothetical protein